MDWDERTLLIDRALDEHRSATLWRYTDLPELVNLLSERALSCVRVDVFDDPYEGRLAGPTSDRLSAAAEAAAGERPLDSDAAFLEELRRVTYLHPWRIDDYEDYGMWYAYASPSSGLAVKTTVDDLVAAIRAGDGYDGRLALERVEYVDGTDDMDPADDGVFFPFRFKRVQHRNEREVRLLVTDYPHERTRADESFTAPADQEPIRQVPVDVPTLVDEIRLHPKSEAVLRQAVENLLAMSSRALDPDVIQDSSLRPEER